MHREPQHQDIVARLRMYANASIEGEWSSVFRADLNIAADEIERLRSERDEAEPLLQELWERRTESTEICAEIERLRARIQLVESAEREQAAARTTIARIREIDNAEALPVGRPWNAMDA